MSSIETETPYENGSSASSASTEPTPAGKNEGALHQVQCFSSCTDITTNTTANNETEEEKNVCWICLDADTPSRPLKQPCKCPRYCHLRCLARWQLQSAGTRRESQCDFCNSQLPDWREALSLQCNMNAPAIMNVSFEGKTYSFEVKPGSSGYLQFTEAIRQAFQLPVDSELNITFTCDEPCNEEGSLLTLQGPGAYDAAVYCAFVSAARRQTGHRRSHSVAGTRSLTDPDGSAAMDPHRAGRSGRGHHRSQTTDETPASVIRPGEFLPPTRRSYNRSRSIPTFPVSRTLRNNSATTTAAATHPENQGGAQPRKGWARVAKKVRALYHRLMNK